MAKPRGFDSVTGRDSAEADPGDEQVDLVGAEAIDDRRRRPPGDADAALAAAGRFVYLCDNSCGDEHDRMTAC